MCLRKSVFCCFQKECSVYVCKGQCFHIDFLSGLFIDESGVLRSAAIIVLLFLPLDLLTFALFIYLLL